MIIIKKGTVVISDDDAKCEIRDFHFDCAVGPETTGYILALEFARDRIESLLKDQQQIKGCITAVI